MRAAIYETIFNGGNTNSTLKFDCPSGNCTFAPADTLGFCSTCNDVTVDLTMDCHSASAGEEYPAGTKNTNCTYHLPENIAIGANTTIIDDIYGGPVSRSPNYTQTTNMSIVPLPRAQTLYAAGLIADPGADVVAGPDYKPSTTTFQGIPDPLLAFGRIVFNNSFTPPPVIGSRVKPHATACALGWCVQTLNTSVQNGRLVQSTLRSWLNDSAADVADAYLTPPAAPLNTAQAQAQAPSRTYHISPLANIPLVQFLQKTFTANMSGINLPGSGKTLEEMAELTQWSSDAAQAFWGAEDLGVVMEDLAARMTDALRNAFPDGANSPRGRVYVMQTYVHVSWAWLILPVLLVIFSCVLLLASIITGRGGRGVVWKNSSLAVLLHGFGGGEERGAVVRAGEMEEVARGMRVQLSEGRSGDVRLVAVEQVDREMGSVGTR